MLRRRIIATIVVGCLLAVVLPLPVFAVGFLPCNPLAGDPCMVQDLIILAVNIYNWLLGMAALVAVLTIIVAGLGMLTHSFFEQPEQVLTSSKHGLTRGITGFVIIACAYLIINIMLTALGVDTSTFVGGLLQTYGLF